MPLYGSTVHSTMSTSAAVANWYVCPTREDQAQAVTRLRGSVVPRHTILPVLVSITNTLQSLAEEGWV